MRKNVEHFAIFRERDVASSVNRSANIFAFDVARAIAESHAAAAIESANVTSGDADDGGFDRNAGDAFSFFDRATNGADRGIEIDDGALAQAFGFGGAKRQEFQLLVGKLRDQYTGLGGPDVQTDQIFILFRQSRLPPCFYLFLCTVICPPQPFESGFKTTCRQYCKSTDRTHPAWACHWAKFSARIRDLPSKSPEPK